MKFKPWRKLGFIAVIVVLTAMILPACNKEPSTKETIKNPNTFIAASIGGPETLDPAAAYDTSSGLPFLKPQLLSPLPRRNEHIHKQHILHRQ